MTPDHSGPEASTAPLTVRAWRNDDDPGLVTIMRAQMEIDSGWPPDYARGGDLAVWLGAPATLGRWVGLLDVRPVGHVGVAPVSPGAMADLWRDALPCGIDAMAEICRLVVDPQMRRHGLSGLLTRRAVRATVEAGYVPVADALAHRSASLAMMVAAGWRPVGTAPSEVTDGLLVALVPPQRLVEAALAVRR